jgi:hypothetical protein
MEGLTADDKKKILDQLAKVAYTKIDQMEKYSPGQVAKILHCTRQAMVLCIVQGKLRAETIEHGSKIAYVLEGKDVIRFIQGEHWRLTPRRLKAYEEAM